MRTGTLLGHCARLAALVVLLGLGACVYRINIQQGNYLDPKALEQLATGMTRNQVRFLLGTPMVGNTFDPDRWDYVYYMKRGRIGQPDQRKVTIYFEDDKVTRIERPEQDANRVADSTTATRSENSGTEKSGTATRSEN
jgi:outer membrane protein assembly factor BamE